MTGVLFVFFFFNDTATTEIYTLSLHDALPIYSFLSNVRFSKDGKYISYTKTKANLENNDYEHHVYVYNTESKENKEYTSLGKERNVFWLDENTLLFQSSRDKEIQKKVEEGEEWTEYYSIDVRGGEAKVFLQLPYSVTGIQPCSSGFVFTANYSNVGIDRKSTRLNSSHANISYAV